ncbi:hypothetical protein BAUCODRAFT_145536 [Baudoinia panamericana UAMH 10762]|uniref:NAD(P)-binding domain-containing protein n=1 Tax=Baudoinia panamericana (strain UAMH 10762) TaxID=717646 RepID=M2N7Z7_BAUPA|nr:uncharacterized protein BAUCODRAFT_145536 [Baudoinia panamericana UAMH 10762]EMD00239.1 hypothetical protein BAUCODRAFT_145536 [Baudoinia panamericana UAMH 10762]
MSRRVAFFGATGGCTNACLFNTLEGGHYASVLVRSPEKLQEQLKKRGISNNVVEKRLHIVQGDVRDVETVKQVLRYGSEGVDTIISGIGGIPTPQLSIIRPLTMTVPNICSAATETILRATAEADLDPQPLLVVISANGVLNDSPRDYPLVLTPLYRWLLNGVYDDKRQMEATLKSAKPKGGYLVLRPAVLSDAPGKGLEAVRQGTAEHPVVGFGISREDVGLWMYEKLINTTNRGGFVNTGVQVSY